MIQAWSAYVELAAPDVPEDTIIDMHEALAEHFASVSQAPNGNLAVQLSVDAGTARKALDAALKAVSEAAKAHGVPATVVGVELLTEEELDRRNATPQVPDLVGTSEIGQMLGVSRQRAVQLAQRDDFPPAVAQLKSGPVFLAEQVRAFESRWTRASGRPRKERPGEAGAA
ncbi:hypothetical protein ACFW9F_24385 [Streptomyces sp. NPDC059506]|uniref:hypothetical protein n=1 Tax=Streptomyces sp. NPDC059506 TaxID=3347751 RepID=UPI0036C2FFAF